MSSKVQVPYPFFSDIDGRPLNAGYIYIGEEGKNPEVYPINVFWDEDLTVPAAQPLRTRNGYISKNGRAGKVYIADSGCSITVKNKDALISYTDLRSDTIFGQKNLISSTNSIESLNSIKKWEDRIVYVKDIGFFKCISNVWKPVFNALKSYKEYGYTYPQMLGYNNDAFQKFANAGNSESLFLNGCLNLVKDLFGVSNNAAALSILGNNSDNFRAQIVSGNSQTISSYGMSEDVLVYAGITGRASTSTSNPTYTTNTIVITDSANLSGVKVGSVIRTSDDYWSLVAAISSNIITVEGWYKSGVSGIPAGTTAYLNHVDKVYLGNRVLWVPESFTGTRMVGEEWDFMCANPNVTEKNGLDFVLHDASTQDMDTAFVVRSAKDGKTWLTGYTAKGAGYAAFLATDGISNRTPTLGSYADVSTAQVSQYLNGGNTYAKKCRFSPSSSVYPTLENRYGFSISGGDVTKNATSGTAIDLTAKSWNVFNNSAFSLILPSSNLVDGQIIEILLFGTAAVTITASGGVNVNGSASYVYTPASAYKRLTARNLGGVWFVFS
ncbi:hypothetical protein ABTC80_09135 [Acinetobacter baumannii]